MVFLPSKATVSPETGFPEVKTLNLFSMPAMPLIRPLPCAEMLMMNGLLWTVWRLQKLDKIRLVWMSLITTKLKPKKIDKLLNKIVNELMDSHHRLNGFEALKQSTGLREKIVKKT